MDRTDNPEQLATWRDRRIRYLAQQVANGDYAVPPIDVAHAILFGRPRWGDNPQVAVSLGDHMTVHA